jgi:hypothetical protein
MTQEIGRLGTITKKLTSNFANTKFLILYFKQFNYDAFCFCLTCNSFVYINTFVLPTFSQLVLAVNRNGFLLSVSLVCENDNFRCNTTWTQRKW